MAYSNLSPQKFRCSAPKASNRSGYQYFLKNSRYTWSLTLLIIALTKAIIWETCAQEGLPTFLQGEITNLQQFVPSNSNLAVNIQKLNWKALKMELAFDRQSTLPAQRSSILNLVQTRDTSDSSPLTQLDVLLHIQNTNESDSDGDSAIPVSSITYLIFLSFLIKSSMFFQNKKSSSSSMSVMCLVVMLTFSMMMMPCSAAEEQEQQANGGLVVKSMTTTTTVGGSWNWDWLNNLLKKAVIHIPTIDIRNEFNMTNGTCRNIQIGDLEISLDSTNTIVSAYVKAVTVECNFQYEVTITDLPHFTGDLDAAVIAESANGSIALTYGNYLPESANLTSCEANIDVNKLTFSGSITAKVINLFSAEIKIFLTQELKKETCSIISSLVATNLTNILHDLNDDLKPSFYPPSPSPTPSIPSTVQNWESFSLMNIIYNISRSSGASFLNHMINVFTDGTGMYSLELPIPPISRTGFLANYTISLNTLTVSGLDSFSDIGLLNPIGGVELESFIKLSNIRVSLNAGIQLRSNIANQTINLPSINISLSISDFSFLFTDGLAYDPSVLSKYLLVQLGNSDCLLAPLYSANFTHLNMSYSSLSDFDIEGLNSNFTKIVHDTIAMGYRLFSKAVPVLISNTLNVKIRPVINEFLQTYLQDGHLKKRKESTYNNNNDNGGVTSTISGVVNTFLSYYTQGYSNYYNKSCENIPVMPNNTKYIDFTNDTFITSINSLISSTIGDFSGPFSINKLMNILTNKTGILNLENIPLSIKFNDPSVGSLNISITDLMLGGLSSFYNLQILEPVTPQSLLLRVGVGKCDDSNSSSCDPFAIGASIGYHYKGNGQSTQGNISFSTKLSNLDLGGVFDIAMKSSILWEMTLENLLSSNYTCFIAAIEKAAIEKLFFNMSQITVSKNLTSSSSSLLSSLAFLRDPSDKLTKLILDAYAALSPLLISLGNNLITSSIHESYNVCENISSSNDDSDKKTKFILEIVGGSVGAVAFLGIGFYVKKRRSSKSRKNNERVRSAVLDSVGGPQSLVEHHHNKVSAWESTLHMQEAVPTWAKVLIPLLLFATIGLFLSAHMSLGADVSIYVNYGEKTLKQISMFQFTLSNSVTDMWQAQVYALSILIAVCSGGWPYLKSALLLLCWFVPRKGLSRHRREQLLMWLDFLGKWSLIDAYVLVLFIVAFRFHLVNPSFGIPSGIFSFDVFVTPGWGIHGFIIAAIVQLIATHLIIHYHREAEGKQERMREMTGGSIEAVRQHHFTADKGKIIYKCTFLGQLLVSILIAGTIAMVVIGSELKSFSFNFQGAAEVALALFNSPSHTTYSLLSLGNSVASSTKDPSDIGVRFLQVSFMIFVFAVPLLHLVSILLLWIAPLSVSKQRWLFISAEVLNAWASLEVFVVSIIASILEISQFASFIIGDKCDQIVIILKEFSELYPNIYPPSIEDSCFDVKTTLDEGCWTLFGSCFVVIVVGTFVTRGCKRALEDRILGYTTNAEESTSSSDDEKSSKCCSSCCSSQNLTRCLSSAKVIQLLQDEGGAFIPANERERVGGGYGTYSEP
eukprot:c20848_g1_i1.p1 GENE.c20848_g1_i1~~c20848_g1_i1.p1  ORF type:complete len:1549 (+),score=654.29 c20848_g1_i1:86-4732(+)